MTHHRAATLLAAASVAVLAASAPTTARVVADATNDVWTLLSASAIPSTRHATADDAIAAAVAGDLLLVLAGRGVNATNGTDVGTEQYAAASAKGLPVYVEMPRQPPPLPVEQPPLVTSADEAAVARGTVATTAVPRRLGRAAARWRYVQRRTTAGAPSSGSGNSGDNGPVLLDVNARIVVATAGRASTGWLPALSILQANAEYVTPLDAASFAPWTVAWVGVVAGVGTAVFGLPPRNASVPALVELPAPSCLLVASLPLSNMVTGRFSPLASWAALWDGLLATLLTCVSSSSSPAAAAAAVATHSPTAFPGLPRWDPPVRPNASDAAEGARRAVVAAKASAGNATARAELASLERAAAIAAIDWLSGAASGLLVAGSDAVTNATCAAPFWPGGAPSPPLLACVREGFASGIAPDGSQVLAGGLRADCNGETAMAVAMRAWLGDGGSGSISVHAPTPALAGALLNYTLLYSWAQGGPRNTPGDARDGIVAWYAAPDPGPDGASYGDDNARVLCAGLLTMAVLRTPGPGAQDTGVWASRVLSSLLANFRSSSAVAAYRWGRVNMDDFGRQGWRYFYESSALRLGARRGSDAEEGVWRRGRSRTTLVCTPPHRLLLLAPAPPRADWTYATDPVFPQPHYQAQMWGAYLLGYALTGYRPFYEGAAAGM